MGFGGTMVGRLGTWMMTAVTKLRMTADEFIPWAMNQPKRYELVGGEVVAMSPERVGHTEARATYTSLCVKPFRPPAYLAGPTRTV